MGNLGPSCSELQSSLLSYRHSKCISPLEYYLGLSLFYAACTVGFPTMIAKGIHVIIEHLQTQNRKHTEGEQAIHRPIIQTQLLYFSLFPSSLFFFFSYIVLSKSWFGSK